MKILVPKKNFDKAREQFKSKINQWSEVLDPDDIRQFEKFPEIAHLARDNLSESQGSYTTRSVVSILSFFEIEEIKVKKTTKDSTPLMTETTPSDISDQF